MIFRLTESGIYGRHELYASDEQLPVPLLGELVVELYDLFAE